MTDIEKIIFALEAKRENFKSHERDMCEFIEINEE